MTGASNHVFSRAIFEFLSNPAPRNVFADIQTVAGRGLRATTTSGQTVMLGSISWMQYNFLNWGPQLTSVRNNSDRSSGSWTAISYDNQVQALFQLEETVRPSAIPAIRDCLAMGLDQSVLTGDRLECALYMARALNLPIQAQLMPNHKLEIIQEARDRFGRVTMVGDGLNDAPALVAADVGIAMGCGTDVTRDSADVCLLTSNLRLVPWSIDFARRTVRTIRMNLVWAFGYNCLGVIVAASGHLHPAVAAILMVASSLMVMGNSFRLAQRGADFDRESEQSDPDASQRDSSSALGTAPETAI
jgi:P-type E1-E2 ATPase